jgi:hypothetical protein
MDVRRILRVSEAIRVELSEIISFEMDDPSKSRRREQNLNKIR